VKVVVVDDDDDEFGLIRAGVISGLYSCHLLES